MNQKTIAKSFKIEGIGLHTGKQVMATFLPCEEATGIKFRRIDLDQPVEILASLAYVGKTRRGTSLQKQDVEIHTIEHIVSALSGLGIDNINIDMDGPELPIMDGSVQPLVKSILNAGIKEIDKEKEFFFIKEKIEFVDENTGSEYLALPSDDFSVTVMLEFENGILSSQFAHMDSLDQYKDEIAPARTFVFLSELEKLFDNGLIKGGDLNNAVVIADHLMDDSQLKDLATKLDHPHIKIGQTGVINEEKLRFRNEPARHKLLDLIGDLGLLGKNIRGKIIAKKPGHSSNVAFAKVLKQKYQEQKKLKNKPDYDPNKEGLLDAVGIQQYLPHRFPFLLVDKIIELTDTRVVGIKNISFNEFYFQGHFPNNPVFPGVLQMEALAQTGGILALTSQDDPGNWDTYFLKMDNVKFKRMVVPGDTLILKMELLSPIRRGIVHMQGTAYVGNQIVSEGELTAQIVKRS